MTQKSEICDREKIENESEYNNINLDEFDKILSDYISHHNKKFYLYFIKCEFELVFDNIFTAKIEKIIII